MKTIRVVAVVRAMTTGPVWRAFVAGVAIHAAVMMAYEDSIGKDAFLLSVKTHWIEGPVSWLITAVLAGIGMYLWVGAAVFLFRMANAIMLGKQMRDILERMIDKR